MLLASCHNNLAPNYQYLLICMNQLAMNLFRVQSIQNGKEGQLPAVGTIKGFWTRVHTEGYELAKANKTPLDSLINSGDRHFMKFIVIVMDCW
jgi:hypothetical protein